MRKLLALLFCKIGLHSYGSYHHLKGKTFIDHDGKVIIVSPATIRWCKNCDKAQKEKIGADRYE